MRSTVDLSGEALFRRYTEARNWKDRWLALYTQLYQYVIPDRNALNVKYNYRDDGLPTTISVWDSTAVIGAYTRANDLHGLLMPKDRVWGKLVLDPHMFSEDEIEAYADVFDEMNQRIFFYLNESNISRIGSASLLDLVGGTGAIWLESISDEKPINFRSIPAVTIYIEYSTDDLISNCWYTTKMSGREFLYEYPDYKGALVDALLTDPNQLFHVIYGQIKLSEEKFYIYCILEDDPMYIAWEVERSYQQIIIIRDKVRPGEAEGRGIGLDLLPNIIDLNKVVEYSRKSMAMKAYPPAFYNDVDYFNPWSIYQWAGAMIPRRPGQGNPIEFLQTPVYPEVLETIKDLREMVRLGFQVDPLGEITTPVKTATEISIRENRAQRSTATDISRLINEFPQQIYINATKILSERRLLTANREFQMKFNEGVRRPKFEFMSPLFDIQKESNINRFVNNMQIKEQLIGPQAGMGSLNIPEAISWFNDQFNLPNKIFRNKSEVQQLIDTMNEMQQQAMNQPQQGEPPFQQSQQLTI